MQSLRTSASGTGLREPIVDKRSGKDVFCCRGQYPDSFLGPSPTESGARQQKRDLWAHLDFAQAFDVVCALV
jgi:hypothetical protein